MPQHVLPPSLIGAISPFDTIDILQRCAAAQLIPDNAQRLFRLEYLSTAAASVLPSYGKPKISATRLRRLLDSGMGIAHLEDSVTWPFTESLAFIGGDSLVLPGLTEGLRPGIDLILAAAFLDPGHPELNDFRAAIAHPCQALLRLSDAMCRAAGLSRGEAPGEVYEAASLVPAGDQLARLVAAATWSDASLKALLEAAGLSPADLSHFYLPLGTPISQDFSPGYGPLILQPLVRACDSTIVALPHSLLTALSRFVLDTAHSMGVLRHLSQAFHDAAAGLADRSLDLLRLPELDSSPPSDSSPAFTTQQFRRLDTDKVLHAVIVTDDFSDYSPASPFGNAQSPPAADIDKLFSAGIDLATKASPNTQVLGLLVMCGIARYLMLGLNGGSAEQEVLVVHMSELVTLSRLERGSPLYLWHFAQARRRLRATTETMAWSLTDELFFYRKKDSSFYVTDDAPPTFISWHPNEGGALLLETYKRFDPHAIRRHPDAFQQCIRVYPNSSIPVYTPEVAVRREHAQCVEVSTGVVWVRTRLPQHSPLQLGHHMALRLVDALAFWLSRVQHHAIVSAAGERHTTIEVCASSPQDWKYPTEPINQQVAEPHLSLQYRQGEMILHATFAPEAMQALVRTRDNPERAMLAPILRTIAEACGLQSTDAELALMKAMPTDLHRKLVPLSSHDTTAAFQHGLPPLHHIEPASEQEVLDEIGETLSAMSVPKGPIAAELRTSVLNGIVKALFGRLEELVATLSTEGVVEWLIAHNEAVVDSHSMALHMEPYNLACFGDEAGPAQDFAARLTDLYKVDQTGRFLLEYVAARPPTGETPMSYGLYDRLLALATKIMYYGTLSDDIRYGSDDPQLSHLGSGRLGTSESRRQTARDQYLTAYGSGRRARLIRVSSSDPDWVTAKQEAAIQAIESASAAEFGFSLAQHAELMEWAQVKAAEQAQAVSVFSTGEFLDTMSSDLGLERRIAADWLALLSLGERKSFLDVPKPSTQADVYPWRFNRSWSYVRRPFIVRAGNVLFGMSHVDRAGVYLRNLCYTGRLRATTPAMQRAIGKCTEIAGHRFNHTIAELFRTRPDLVVRERIERFGGTYIAGPLGSLGDIDVLVADRRSRCIRAYECKDLSVARTPPEIYSEVKEFTVGDKSIVAKHQRRVDWLKSNLGAVLSELKLPAHGRWDVRGVVVVDEELVSPFLVDIKMQVLTIADVESLVASNRRLS